MDLMISEQTARQAIDPRAEKTRQAILDSVQSLISDRVTSVTVSDIVRVAGISRSSFYVHFGNLDELAVDFLREQFAEIATSGLEAPSGASRKPAVRAGYRRLIGHIVGNYPLYSTVLDLPLTRGAFDAVVEAYSSRLLSSIVQLAQVPAGVNAHLVTTYVAGGTLTTISAWMRGDIDLSDDEMVEHLVALLPDWLLEPGERGAAERSTSIFNQPAQTKE